MKTYQLDPKKFLRIRRNIILTYFIFSILGLVIFYLYFRDALFGQVWILVPFVLLLFAAAGWFAVRQRRRYWDEFKLTINDSMLIRAAPKLPDARFNKNAITGVKEVRQGLILSTRASENALLIPKALPDEDYLAVKQVLEKWIQKRG